MKLGLYGAFAIGVIGYSVFNGCTKGKDTRIADTQSVVNDSGYFKSINCKPDHKLNQLEADSFQCGDLRVVVDPKSATIKRKVLSTGQQFLDYIRMDGGSEPLINQVKKMVR